MKIPNPNPNPTTISYMSTDVIVSVYYALIHSFIIHGIEVWGLTYPSFLKPICTLQKKAVRILIISEPRSHSEPIFEFLRIIKVPDLIEIHISKFEYLWDKKQLPSCFSDNYVSLSEIHSIHTRQAHKKNIYINPFNSDQYGKPLFVTLEPFYGMPFRSRLKNVTRLLFFVKNYNMLKLTAIQAPFNIRFYLQFILKLMYKSFLIISNPSEHQRCMCRV